MGFDWEEILGDGDLQDAYDDCVEYAERMLGVYED